MSIRLTLTHSKPSVICICIVWNSISSAREPRATDLRPQPASHLHQDCGVQHCLSVCITQCEVWEAMYKTIIRPT